ncbi:TRAP transporter small permease [Franzmannia qiaohouensis]|uniref:TRAP transporter small permease protein n=1 Tax=Franzmannia qiaohouensis TaxID=1329370 RepID=A0ABU1HCI4_9GAMM|nr:TRAP transporter small permease [Halomonas qiaohouensis]MDR5905177.1 TRAP transporter small permease [Halomonas qiaohouensis]
MTDTSAPPHDNAKARGPQPPPRSSAFRRAKRIVELLDATTYWGIVAVMGLMATIVSLQVFWRYVLGSSIDSADELSRLFFVWAIFLAIPHGVKHGVHVGIDLFVMLMPEWMKEVLFRLMAGVSTTLMLMVMLGAWVATLDRWPELMPTLPITSAVYYIAVLICGAHAFLHLALLAWGGSRTWEELT